MTTAQAPALLRGTLAPAEVGALSGSSFTVIRRNVTYTVTVAACSIDDPTDGVGVGDDSFCAAPCGTPVPGSPPPGPAAAVNVLGISVALGGSLLNTVCSALGTPAILGQLTAAVSPVAPPSLCASGPQSTVQFDSRPDDLRRVRADVSWTAGRGGSVSQTTLLTNALPNDCPLTTPVPPATHCRRGARDRHDHHTRPTQLRPGVHARRAPRRDGDLADRPLRHVAEP